MQLVLIQGYNDNMAHTDMGTVSIVSMYERACWMGALNLCGG